MAIETSGLGGGGGFLFYRFHEERGTAPLYSDAKSSLPLDFSTSR